MIGSKSWRSLSCSFTEMVFSIFYCLFRQHLSSAYLLKHWERLHCVLFIRYDKPELTRWCLCSLHAGIQMSPDEVVGSRDSCRHSITEGTVDVPIRLFRQILSARTALFSWPFCIFCSLHLIAVWFLQPIWLPEWSLQLPSFLASYVSKWRAGRSNTSLRTICLHFSITWSLLSTCHMQDDWYCFALP